jgi:hypothetical protein
MRSAGAAKRALKIANLIGRKEDNIGFRMPDSVEADFLVKLSYGSRGNLKESLNILPLKISSDVILAKKCPRAPPCEPPPPPCPPRRIRKCPEPLDRPPQPKNCPDKTHPKPHKCPRPCKN